MSEASVLPVWPTVLSAWRQFAARPDYALRVAWIPVLLILAVGMFSQTSTGGAPVTGFWKVVFSVLNFAVLVQALVAWQRYALPESHPRKGVTGLRSGRAELFTLLHFPLVGILFAPLLVPTLIESVTALDDVDAASNLVIGLTGLGLLVFPGGMLLIRVVMMLTAIAAAGKTPISLIAAANRVWALGAGHSIRMLLVFYLTVLPAALALTLLPGLLPLIARPALMGVLLTLYVMLCGGALAGIHGWLTAHSVKAAKAAA